MSSTLHLVTVFDPALLSHAIHDDDPQVGADGWFPFGDVRPQIDDDRGISSAVCSASQNGDLHVCAIDVAGNLAHTIRFAADGTWQPYWGDVQSQIPQGPDIGPDSAVACAANQAGDLHVCAIGASGTLWHTIRFAADGTWQPYWGDVQSQVPQGPDIGPDSAVACATNQAGDLHVCAIGTSGTLWHTIRFAADGTWQPYWGDVQSQIPQGPDIGPDSAVACAANQAGDLHVCAIGTSGTLWHTIRSAADGTWQPYWGDVQSQTSAAGPVVSLPFSGVSCSTSANDDLHVCCVTVVQGQTTDGQIWYTLRQAGGDWSDFDYVQEALNVIGSNALNASISHA